ncbi:MAG: B12-binding domain-containing radical SAM protein [Nitrospirota bacterium]|jgi:radical SAM superfamily enzyme YgiQ (UPF0313 family)
MKVLFVYPQYPNTFWSFKYALKFISKKASLPPLGLLTVASMLPGGWEKRLVDMNIESLEDGDLKWADFVFISAMSVQKKSADEVIERCNSLGVKVVAGGAHFTSGPEDYPHVDHLVLNEAEITLPMFLRDLQNGGAKHLYTSGEWGDMTETPIPDWSLVKMKHYASANVQYSRGCPFNCEFCNITVLYGRKPRTKDAGQIIAELDSLYDQGWRGGVFFVDDNFIGNRGKLKREVLPALIEWMENKGYPFPLNTEASIDLADDPGLMDLMVKAGFDTVFIGIETPHEESLEECSKSQNKKRDMMDCVKRMQRAGLEVQAGFIVGFDSDPANIFEKVISFIQESGIATAMVGLLNAPKGTRLFQRLVKEGRLLRDSTGNNTDYSINFVPKMKQEALISGYQRIVETIYSPKHYYSRVMNFLREYKRPPKNKATHFNLNGIKALLRSMVLLGIVGKERFHYWKLFFWSLFTRPRLFPLAITLTIYGFHFRKTFQRMPV